MKKKKLRHPGLVLFEDYLTPLGIHPVEVARSTGLGQRHLYNLQGGTQRINAKVALAMERWAGIPARHLMQLQSDYDLQEGQTELAAHLRDIKPRRDRKKITSSVQATRLKPYMG